MKNMDVLLAGVMVVGVLLVTAVARAGLLDRAIGEAVDNVNYSYDRAADNTNHQYRTNTNYQYNR